MFITFKSQGINASCIKSFVVNIKSIGELTVPKYVLNCTEVKVNSSPTLYPLPADVISVFVTTPPSLVTITLAPAPAPVVVPIAIGGDTPPFVVAGVKSAINTAPGFKTPKDQGGI